MRKKYIFINLLAAILSLSLIAAAGKIFLPQILSFYFGNQLKATVKIAKASGNLLSRIKAKDISITNKKGLRCDIKDAEIDYQLLRMIREGINFGFRLKGIELSYPSSNVIGGITHTLSMKPLDSLQFNSAEGRFYYRNKETIIKSLSAAGEQIRFFADGSIVKDSAINYNFRILLSEEIVANIPETIRKVFFRQDGSWSEVKIYIGGTTERPTINFSTELFKLSIT
jgi:hypothetical protein